MIDKDLARSLVNGKPWHHDFEIVPGVRTGGTYDPADLLNQLGLPTNMTGQTMADIGASNGYFSFEARKRGAKVTAFDYRHKDNSGFGLAQYINEMNDIEHHQLNVLQLAPEQYGQFDTVLALGLFYHTSDPYLALANCAAVSRDRLLIESYCIDSGIPAELSDQPVMRFIPDATRFPLQGQPNTDRSNFWGFTSSCLRRMLEDVGFEVTKIAVRDDRVFIDAKRVIFEPNGTRLWLAHGAMGQVPLSGSRDDPNAWTIF